MWACFWNHFWTPFKNGSGHFFMIFGVPKWIQKGDFISVLGVHGAPGAPKYVFGPESCISRPPKVTPRSDNRLKKEANVSEQVFLNLARRTARSGLKVTFANCSELYKYISQRWISTVISTRTRRPAYKKGTATTRRLGFLDLLLLIHTATCAKRKLHFANR